MLIFKPSNLGLLVNCFNQLHYCFKKCWATCSDQGILKGEVSLYHWPPVWLVWNQLYDYWQFLLLLAKQTNPNQSNRRSQYIDTCPFSILCSNYCCLDCVLLTLLCLYIFTPTKCPQNACKMPTKWPRNAHKMPTKCPRNAHEMTLFHLI